MKKKHLGKIVLAFITMGIMLSLMIVGTGFAVQGAQSKYSTTYYFSTSGNDINDGLSPSKPKKSLNWIKELLQPGVQILLKRGDVWYDTRPELNFEYLKGTAQAPMRVAAYGDASKARPCIAVMFKNDRSEWKKEGQDLYSCAQSNATEEVTFRVYLGGLPLRRMPTLAELGDNQYCISDNRIFIKSKNFSKYPFVESIQASNFGLMKIANTSYLTFEDLEIKGGDGWCAIVARAPTDHITFNNVYLHQFIHYGITFGLDNPQDGLKSNNDITITNCTIDKAWTADMNNEYMRVVSNTTLGCIGPAEFPKVTEGASERHAPGGDGITIGDNANNVIIKGNTITNMGHSGIGNQIDSENNLGTHHMLIEQNVVTKGASNYCRGFNIVGGKAQSSDIIIRRNLFADMTNASHFGGYHNYLYSNIFDTTTVTPTYQNLQPYCVDTMVGPQYPGTFVVDECVIANNTFSNADAFIRYYNYPVGNPSFLNKNIVANNIFAGWRNSSYSEYGNALVFADGYPDHFAIKNNAFWNGSKGQSLQYRAYQGMDLAALNGVAGNNGNLEMDPAFVGGKAFTAEKFRLSSASPLLKGAIPLSQILPVGVDAVDYFGKAFASNPSFGAIQNDVKIQATPGKATPNPTPTNEPGNTTKPVATQSTTLAPNVTPAPGTTLSTDATPAPHDKTISSKPWGIIALVATLVVGGAIYMLTRKKGS